MPVFSNLIARLTMDSRGFEGAAKRSSRSLRGLTAQTLSLHKSMIRLGAAYIGVRGVVRGIKSVTQAAMVQQTAERNLRAALALTNNATAATIASLKAYAAEMQRVTTYGDEQIIDQMAYAKTMGVTTDQLKDATKAAIGLAAGFRMDLAEAFRVVALAAQGETSQLKRRGIIIDQNLSVEEKRLAVLREGHKRFSLATDATRDAAGAAEQASKAWGDAKEALGAGLLPAVTKTSKAMTKWLRENQQWIASWADSVVDGIGIVIGAMGDLRRAAAETANQQSPIRDLLEGFGKDTQSRIWKAYESQTGEKAGWQAFDTSGGLSPETMTTRRWVEPTDQAYMRRLIASYRRALQKRWAPEVATLAGRDATAAVAPGETTTGGQSPAQATMDTAAALRRMLSDLDTKSKESWALRRGLLREERDEYLDMMGERRELVNDWFREQTEKMDIAEAKATGGFFEGARAGIAELRRDMATIGELGANIARDSIGGIASGLADAVFEARNLGDAMREVARSAARMAFEWGVQQFVTSGLSAAFGGGAEPAAAYPAHHHGGIVGRSAPSGYRTLPAAAMMHAPRLHGGLRSDEFPAILQQGEEVRSRQQVQGGHGDAVAQLSALRAIGDRIDEMIFQFQHNQPNVVVVSNPEEIVERGLDSPRGQKSLTKALSWLGMQRGF